MTLKVEVVFIGPLAAEKWEVPNDFDNFVVGDTLTKSCIIKQEIFDEEIKLY